MMADDEQFNQREAVGAPVWRRGSGRMRHFILLKDQNSQNLRPRRFADDKCWLQAIRCGGASGSCIRRSRNCQARRHVSTVGRTTVESGTARYSVSSMPSQPTRAMSSGTRNPQIAQGAIGGNGGLVVVAKNGFRAAQCHNVIADSCRMHPRRALVTRIISGGSPACAMTLEYACVRSSPGHSAEYGVRWQPACALSPAGVRPPGAIRTPNPHPPNPARPGWEWFLYKR